MIAVVVVVVVTTTTHDGGRGEDLRGRKERAAVP